MTNNKQILNLLKKKAHGNLNENEKKILYDWVGTNYHRKKLIEDLGSNHILYDEVELWINLEESDDEPFENRLAIRVKQKEFEIASEFQNKFYTKKLVYLVASLFLICGVGILIYFVKIPDLVSEQVRTDEIIVDLPSGSSKATIHLSDGTKLNLAEDKEGVILGDDIVYNDGSKLKDYNGKLSNDVTIDVPKGGKYQITLPDGSQVWLNSESSLKYSQNISEGYRSVELIGEAYFDVKKLKIGARKIPFKVRTRNEVIEVIGTQFNVKCYADELESYTTLVEGLVNVKQGNQTIKIIPGNQTISNSKGIRMLTNVDTSEFLAWKNDKFIFNETPIKPAMKQLSRWYNVEVYYQGDIKPTYFYGEISRSKNLRSVLDILKESGVQFELKKSENKTILLVTNN